MLGKHGQPGMQQGRDHPDSAHYDDRAEKLFSKSHAKAVKGLLTGQTLKAPLRSQTVRLFDKGRFSDSRIPAQGAPSAAIDHTPEMWYFAHLCNSEQFGRERAVRKSSS
jgi:hypothetical protein